MTGSAGSNITLHSGSGFSRPGYTFTGWNTNASGTGTNYNVGSSYTLLGNITLYAKWDIVLAANTWRDGSISPQTNNEQWFRFTATATTQYIHVSFGTLTDLYVDVYQSDQTSRVGSEVNLYGSNRYTSRTLTVGQVCYIRVRPYSGYSGTYQITFNASATAPPQ